MAMDCIPRVETRQRTLPITGPIPPLKPPPRGEENKTKKKNSRRCQTSPANTDYKVAQVPEQQRTKTSHLRPGDAIRGLTHLVTDKGCSGQKWAKWMIRAAYVMGGHRKMWHKNVLWDGCAVGEDTHGREYVFKWRD